MKPKLFVLIVVVAVAGAAAGWFAARNWPTAPAAPAAGGRKVLYYQSAMHPWIKSDQPGKCTICGMDLVPVYEGDPGFDAGEGLVTLSPSSINVINVQTEEVRRRPLRRTVRVAGTIDDDDTRHRVLSAYVDGRIDKLFVNYVGAEVAEGEPLAAIYSPMLLNAEREYVLLVAPKPDPGEAPEGHRRLVESARLRLRRLGLTERQISALPQKPAGELHTEILAPMSGTVVARNVYEGQYVKEGDRLFELSDFSTMWFQFDAYERDLAWLKVGQTVEVTTPAAPGKVYPARISFIDPNLNDPTRSAKVRVEIPNPIVDLGGRRSREFLHRLYAEGAVQVDVPEVLAVPRSAVLSPGAQPVVYVEKGGGTYEQRRVKLGRAGDEFHEVLDGLSEGDRIVTSGNLLIDAQAQLNQSANSTPADQTTSSTSTQGGPGSPSPSVAGASAESLMPTQAKAVREFLAAADAVRSALSADNLSGFNQQVATLHEKLPSLLNAFDTAPAWQPLIAQIEANAHLEEAKDLKAARKAFYGFSTAVVELVQKLRPHEEAFRSMKIFQCPMLKQAFPGAPQKGAWVQMQGPLRNPYFGAEMIDCGTEVK
jgi:Cu(I)/Ag(I) efflux system membrane fusion protein